jgi:hypothetical protein
MEIVTLDLLEKSKTSPWDLGNDLLYQLCREHFKHENEQHILAKTLFIGRIYAAALERRKKKDEFINDDFYADVVVPTFRDSDIDTRLARLKKFKSINDENIPVILQTHQFLIELFQIPTELNKRSFSSKYLHFHLPELFFIYDSRAETALRQFKRPTPKELKFHLMFDGVDQQYAQFYGKCLDVKKHLEQQFNTSLTHRQFDSILIDIANTLEANKRKASVKN